MNILNLDTISKNFGDKALFSNLTFGLSAGERVGLIGVNGSGKTTLFKIIAGLEPPDSGTITVRGTARVAYLPQDPTMDPAQRVLDYVYGDDHPALQLLRSYTEVTQQLEQAPEDAALLAELSHLSETMTRTNAWDGEVAARTILSRLGIRALDAPLGQLSGGQRKRVALARVLIEQPDLLILDEPTNHIDPDTIAWLEGYLANLPGALLLITHDRYFLDRVATRIIELDDHTIYSYPGNYAQFVEARLERARLQEQADVVLRNAAKRELAWLRAGVQARTTKQKARVQRATALVNTERRETPRELELSQVGRRMGKQLIELREVSKALGGRPVIENFSLELARDDRLGIIGPNGMGKSTLLNLIAGRLQPDSGEVVVGETMHIAYYDQTSSELDLKQRLIDYVSDGAAVITTADGSTLTAGQMLERFLFPPHQHWSTIESLSGGERRRLYLLRVLLRNPNILLLDEPSNDLDVQTIAVLEEYLEYFPGAVIVVSHDRALLDNVAEHLLVFEEPGQIRRFPGDYTAYREQRQRELREADEVTRRPAAAAPSARAERPRKLSFKEQRLLEQLEQQIARLEQEQTRLNTAINMAGADYTTLTALTARLEQCAQELEATFDQWAALAERLENGS